jgi:hypothetical protein
MLLHMTQDYMTHEDSCLLICEQAQHLRHLQLSGNPLQAETHQKLNWTTKMF